MFAYASKDHSWVWDANSNTLSSVKNDTLPGAVAGSYYSFFELNGSRAMSLGMEFLSQEAFEFGTHEFFHHEGQRNWIREGSSSRGTIYPASKIPRLYRRMMFDRLKEFLLTNNQSSLSKAKFWFEKWKSEFPKEAQSTTDGYEGTARYVEMIASKIAALGCSASDEELKADLIVAINEKMGLIFEGNFFQLDSEGYDLGGLASIILRFGSKPLAEWNQRVAKGETPLDILLDGVQSSDDSLSHEMVRKFTDSEKRINLEMGKLLDPAISHWKNKDFVRVPSPHQWRKSNLSPKYFAVSEDIGLNLFPLAQDLHLVSPLKEGSDFTLKSNTVILQKYPNPCESEYAFALLSKSAFSGAKDLHEIQADLFTGKLVGEFKVDEEGFTYFCVK
ncbi:MAG TPA: hypothetical protein DCL41_06210 [Bdellovibrionales bacterium]|nr:hypothetical protein [Bdellovibrionales bacterium]